MKLKIRYKILFGFALVLVLSLAAQTVGYQIADRYIHQEIGTKLTDKAEAAGTEVESFFTKVEGELLGISKAYIQDPRPDYPTTLAVSKHIFRQSTFYESITILGRTGKEEVRLDKTGSLTTQNLTFEIPTSPFQQALAGKTSISKVFFLEDKKTPRVNIFTPIVSEGGAITGVVKAQLDLERLWDVIAKIKLGETGFAYVLDEEGRVIAHPNLAYLENAPNLIQWPLVKSLNTTMSPPTALFNYRNEKGEEVVGTGIILSGNGWMVITEQTQAEAFQARNLLKNLHLVTIAMSAALLLVMSFLLSKNITKPIEQLKEMTGKIQKGNLDVRVAVKSRDELEDLATSFNTMSSQVKNAFSQLNQKVTELEKKRQELALTTNQLKNQETVLREVNKSAEREKETAEAERNKVEILLAGINDGVIAVDLDRKIVIFNPAAERITGYKAEEVLGSHLQTVVKVYDNKEEVPIDTYCPQVVDRFEGIVYKKENVMLTGKGGKKSYVDLMSGQIREGMDVNLGSIISFHDITDLEELERMKLDFVSMAAHELRTPLTTVLGYLSFLQDDKVLQKLTDQEKEFLKRVGLSATRLNMLIENLLVVSRIEQGTLVLHLEPVALEQILEKLVKEFTGLAHSKGLRLSFTRSSDTFPKVNADPVRIEEVVSNLVGNAINYTQKGEVTVNLQKKEQELIFSVKDTGQGIPKEAQSHLFTKFFRIQGKLESGSKGTGLGLYISKNIIDAHRGKIWVESEVGAGSTFYFSLPIINEK